MYVETFNNLKIKKGKRLFDFSSIPSHKLADEAESLIQHHSDCIVFLGYLEPGWMLDPKHEARLRALFRKFETHMICFFPESIPFSWKNEIDIVYLNKLQQNECPKIINNGSIMHVKFDDGYPETSGTSSDK
jgi:hypothetical protein